MPKWAFFGSPYHEELKMILEYFLSVEHGGNVTIFDTRRGKINTLDGGIKGKEATVNQRKLS